MRKAILAGLLAPIMWTPSCATTSEAAELYDNNRTYLGRIEDDGTMRDAQGRKVGEVRDEVIYDEHGSRVGRWESDGVLRDALGRKVGEIRNGNLYGPDGQRRGRVK